MADLHLVLIYLKVLRKANWALARPSQREYLEKITWFVCAGGDTPKASVDEQQSPAEFRQCVTIAEVLCACKLVSHSPHNDEWGPDLVFLGLPDSDVGNIKMHKSFWNLGKRREMKSQDPSEIANAAWVIMGAPERRIQQTGNRIVFEMCAAVCPAEAYFPRSGFDYVHLGIDATATSGLETYGGMSGSGLWRVRLIRNQAGHLVWLPKELSLEGLAFYESPVVDGHRIIRCHGRKSLYSDGLDAIDASAR